MLHPDMLGQTCKVSRPTRHAQQRRSALPCLGRGKTTCVQDHEAGA